MTEYHQYDINKYLSRNFRTILLYKKWFQSTYHYSVKSALVLLMLMLDLMHMKGNITYSNLQIPNQWFRFIVCILR